MRKPRPYSQLKGGVGKSPLTLKGVEGINEGETPSPAKAVPLGIYYTIAAIIGAGGAYTAGTEVYGYATGSSGREIRRGHLKQATGWAADELGELTLPDYSGFPTYAEAHAAANKDLGPNGVYVWNGSRYRSINKDQYSDDETKKFWEQDIWTLPEFKDNFKAVKRLKEAWVSAGQPNIVEFSAISKLSGYIHGLGKFSFKKEDYSPATRANYLPRTRLLNPQGQIAHGGDFRKIVDELAHTLTLFERDDMSEHGFGMGDAVHVNDVVIDAIRNEVLGSGDNNGLYDYPEYASEEAGHYYGYAQHEGEYIVGNESFVGWGEEERDDSGNPAMWFYNEDTGERDLTQGVNGQMWFYNRGSGKAWYLGEESFDKRYYDVNGNHTKLDDDWDKKLTLAYFSQDKYGADWHQLLKIGHPAYNPEAARRLLDGYLNGSLVLPDLHIPSANGTTYRDINMNFNPDQKVFENWTIGSMPYRVGDNNKLGIEGITNEYADRIGGNDYYAWAYLGIDPVTNVGGKHIKEQYKLKNGHYVGEGVALFEQGSEDMKAYYDYKGWNYDANSGIPKELREWKDGEWQMVVNPNYVEQTEAQNEVLKTGLSGLNNLDPEKEGFEYASTLRAEAYNKPGISGEATRRGIFNDVGNKYNRSRSEMVYNEDTEKKEEVGKLLDVSIHPRDYHLFEDIGTYSANNPATKESAWGDGSDWDVLTNAKQLILEDRIYDGVTNRKVEWKEGQKEEYLQSLNDYIDSLNLEKEKKREKKEESKIKYEYGGGPGFNQFPVAM